MESQYRQNNLLIISKKAGKSRLDAFFSFEKRFNFCRFVFKAERREVLTLSNIPAIELKNITKSFGSVIANNNINLSVFKGEILSILGENGSGKTTLMNMISGIYYPDSGHILINGEEVVIRSPKDAFDYKIGMIHQHFKLVDVFSATENIILGLNDSEKYNIKESSIKVKNLADKYGFDIDPDKKIYQMSVSEKQTVEILKVLYKGADILILDEPTAVLTPQETDKLFKVIRKMRDDGKSIIIITHKLHEVLSLSDRVSVLRKGEYIGTVKTSETNESELTEMMVGKKIELNIKREDPVDPTLRLEVKNLTCLDTEGVVKLNNVSFEVNSGEILLQVLREVVKENFLNQLQVFRFSTKVRFYIIIQKQVKSTI